MSDSILGLQILLFCGLMLLSPAFPNKLCSFPCTLDVRFPQFCEYVNYFRMYQIINVINDFLINCAQFPTLTCESVTETFKHKNKQVATNKMFNNFNNFIFKFKL